MAPYFLISVSKESEPVRTELTDKKTLVIQGKQCIIFVAKNLPSSVWIGPANLSGRLPVVGTDKDGHLVNISATSLQGAMFIKEDATPVTLTTPKGKELGKIIYEAPNKPKLR